MSNGFMTDESTDDGGVRIPLEMKNTVNLADGIDLPGLTAELVGFMVSTPDGAVSFKVELPREIVRKIRENGGQVSLV